MCDYVGLLSDGELLLMDTPRNLRRAAFSGEVVDVTTNRPLTESELERVGDRDFVVGEVERTEPNMIRVVVDDAERAVDQLNGTFAELGVDVIEAGEHEVDYDEAFVRVVERHRRTTADGEISDTVDEDVQDDAHHDEDAHVEDGRDEDGRIDAEASTATSDGADS